MTQNHGMICIAAFKPTWDLFEIQLRSIQNQTADFWSATIGIDGRDEELDIRLKEFLRGDERFIVKHYKDRVGHYRNFERLLAEVDRSRPWVALCDQDDRWYPHKLDRLIPWLDEYDLVCGQASVVNLAVADRKPSEVTSRSDASLAAMLIDNRVTGAFSLLSTRMLEVALPFPDGTDVAFHDHWLAVCAKTGGGIKFVDEVLQDYHQHGGNVIGEEKAETIRYKLARLRTKAKLRMDSGSSTQYLVEHRWGWRVRMARCLRQRATAQTSSMTTIRAFASGTFSLVLLRIVAKELSRGSVPATRAIAMLLGAAVTSYRGLKH